MYSVRLSIPLLVKLNIHNQCLNVNLVSPAYIIGYGSMCYRAPGYKIYSGNVMRCSFINKSDNKSVNALIYKLQRRRSHASTEIDQDTASAAQLLVILTLSKFGSYADVLLVKHDKEFNKYSLEELCRKNINQLRRYLGPVIETWLLDDNTALTTAFEMMNEGRLLNVTISEIERYYGVRTPARIDPGR
jgi:hypothetical protein